MTLHPSLAEHLAECAECQAHSAAIDSIAMMLDAQRPAIDGERLTADSMLWLAAAVESNASEALWRRVINALLLAVAPLPLVLVWDAYLLRTVYAFLESLVPGPIATYVTVSYCAFFALLLAGTYAAIPISIGRGRRTSALVRT